jgi:hypothetical protein
MQNIIGITPPLKFVPSPHVNDAEDAYYRMAAFLFCQQQEDIRRHFNIQGTRSR